MKRSMSQIQKWKGRPAAFFDFDRTMISANSGVLYAQYEKKKGRVTSFQFGKAMLWALLYHLNWMNIEKAIQGAISHYKGLSEQEMQERTQIWFEEANIESYIQPGALERIEYHRQQNHPIVLLTGSTSYLAQIVQKKWDLDGWLANSFPLDAEGKLTGGIELPLCYGAGKVHYAEEWAKQEGIDLEQSYFYTDSYSDLAMLERIQHPFVVNPDPKLRRKAAEKGWSVLDWSQKSEKQE